MEVKSLARLTDWLPTCYVGKSKANISREVGNIAFKSAAIHFPIRTEGRTQRVWANSKKGGLYSVLIKNLSSGYAQCCCVFHRRIFGNLASPQTHSVELGSSTRDSANFLSLPCDFSYNPSSHLIRGRQGRQLASSFPIFLNVSYLPSPFPPCYLISQYWCPTAEFWKGGQRLTQKKCQW